jgi:hypothetical protein
MSLRIRFRFDGRCSMHPRYNPQKDGSPQHRECSGCESLYVIHLYCDIARKKAVTGDGILVSNPEIPAQADDSCADSAADKSPPAPEQGN